MLADLQLRYSRHETEMIVIVAAFVASITPPADLAMLYRVGISLCRFGLRERCQKAALHLPEVGGIIERDRQVHEVVISPESEGARRRASRARPRA